MSASRRGKRGDPATPDPEAPAAAGPPKRALLDVNLPHPFGGAPLCRASLALETTRHSSGESFHLRLHLDGWLRPAPAAKPALPLARTGLVAFGRQAAGGLARRGFARLPAFTGGRLRSWIDVRASTAPLAAGADALLPARLRALTGGPVPRPRAGEPRIGLWQDRGAAGEVAQLALLQMDQSDLPPRYRDRPFSLAASIATAFEPGAGDEPQG